MKKIFNISDCTIVQGFFDCPYLVAVGTEDFPDEQDMFKCVYKTEFGNIIESKLYKLKANLFKKCPLMEVGKIKEE